MTNADAIRSALALADDPATTPALRALSLQLREVQARSLDARRRHAEAEKAATAAVADGMKAGAEANALVRAIEAVAALEADIAADGPSDEVPGEMAP